MAAVADILSSMEDWAASLASPSDSSPSSSAAVNQSVKHIIKNVWHTNMYLWSRKLMSNLHVFIFSKWLQCSIFNEKFTDINTRSYPFQSLQLPHIPLGAINRKVSCLNGKNWPVYQLSVKYFWITFSIKVLVNSLPISQKI